MEAFSYEAGPELTALLRRYYTGEAELWPQIQALVDADLRARSLPVAPRHLRFRLTSTGYLVIIEDAGNYLIQG